jgi:hypothetical protein
VPTHTTKKTYKKPYIGPALPQKPNTITILTIPNEEWTTNDTPYKTIFDDTHVIIHFTAYNIIYTKPIIPLELNKEPRTETLALRILCIHYKNTSIDIPNLKSKLLQITTNLQINPLYITPLPHTPINTKVHKHPKWNKSPYPPQFIPSNSIQLPNFLHTHHSKFPP